MYILICHVTFLCPPKKFAPGGYGPGLLLSGYADRVAKLLKTTKKHGGMLNRDH